ncbi:aminotransferase class I/II-fold pyridoxal phosphate-dependent enzyme [Streptomyces sp. I6]|nr:aminotransferase class I/II-fold pyridoxal phosphate-dependent enzyme [Streptomyces sp. I6]
MWPGYDGLCHVTETGSTALRPAWTVLQPPRRRSWKSLGRDLLADGLEQAGFRVFRPAGTYFITTDIRPLGASDGVTFCRALPERAGVVAIPNAVFYDHREQGAPFVRFAFCKQTDVLEEAVARLKGLAAA